MNTVFCQNNHKKKKSKTYKNFFKKIFKRKNKKENNAQNTSNLNKKIVRIRWNNSKNKGKDTKQKEHTSMLYECRIIFVIHKNEKAIKTNPKKWLRRIYISNISDAPEKNSAIKSVIPNQPKSTYPM